MTDFLLMKKKIPGTVHPHPTQWAPDKLTIFFTEHLNRIYCTRAHLAERLLEVVDADNFKNLHQPIKDTIAETEEQIARMDGIYAQLKKRYSFDNCTSMIAMLEDDFTTIQQQSDDETLRDMSMLLYLQNIETVEKNSIQVLQIAAVSENDHQMNRFLQEHLNRTAAKRTLYNFIKAKYI
jgi:ferritin-like metal-binding protein YciE